MQRGQSPTLLQKVAISQGAEGMVLPLNEVRFHLGFEALAWELVRAGTGN